MNRPARTRYGHAQYPLVYLTPGAKERYEFLYCNTDNDRHGAGARPLPNPPGFGEYWRLIP